MRKRKAFIFLLICILLWVVRSQKVQATTSQTEAAENQTETEQLVQDYDYSDIQNIIDESTSSNESFNFEDYISKIMVENKISMKNIVGGLTKGIASEVRGNIGILSKLIAIAIVAAIFTNFASVFMDNQIAETGFYITYIVLFTIIVASFQVVSELARVTIGNILDFVKVLIPTFFMSISVSNGATTSVVFYEFTLMVISLVNMVLLKLILPAVNVYLVLLLADNLSKDAKLSKFAKTLGTIIKWLLRSLIVLVVGFNAIQSLIAPVADGLKRSAFVKVGGMIPGIGNLLSGVTETVLGASILLKNAIGVAGLLAIIVICAVPVIKLIVYYFIYRLCESVLQPISDKRILKCISACSDAISMVLQVVVVGAILFIISIAIVTASTSMGY